MKNATPILIGAGVLFFLMSGKKKSSKSGGDSDRRPSGVSSTLTAAPSGPGPDPQPSPSGPVVMAVRPPPGSGIA